MTAQISRRRFFKLLSLLPLTLLFNQRSRPIEEANSLSQNQRAPNVLILVFDTLSAKHISLYGYNRETTPHLARFAQKATVYHRHYASGNFTTPGTASLLTGTYPWLHRAFNHGARVAEDYKHRNLFRVFAGDTYNRIAYTDNFWVDFFLGQFRENLDVHMQPEELCILDGHLLGRLFSNDSYVAFRSFEELLLTRSKFPGSLFLSEVDKVGIRTLGRILTREYADLYPMGVPSGGKRYFLLEHAIDGIKDVVGGSQQPFLGYFHLLPPHEPYLTRREFIGLFDDGWVPVAKKPHFFSEGVPDNDLNQLRRQYDEYIAYTDAEFGRLFGLMTQADKLDNTYVVVTSDHGELFERGVWEHNTPLLYEALIHVPLLISKPKQQQREDVYTPTSCVDLLPTLLHATDQAIPDWCEGEVLPTFGDREGSGGQSIFSVEAKINPQHAPLTTGTVALIKDQYKLIYYFGYDGYESEYELYDVVNDPEELEDLYLPGEPTAASLQSELEEKLRTVNQPYIR
jgi:arylsulfatase A-like enzyme